MSEILNEIVPIIAEKLGVDPAEVTMEEAKKVLQLAENNTAYMGTDFKADYSIVTDTPGSGKSVMTAVMYRRDSKGMFLIRILSPDADKGKGYVQFDSTIWYDNCKITLSKARTALSLPGSVCF